MTQRSPLGLALAFVVGFAAGVLWAGRPAPGGGPDVAALQDSLAVAAEIAADADAAAVRALDRARADSIALAEIRRRVRVVPKPGPVPTPADTASGDTLIVYEVPPPVAELVERLERRVVGLEVAVDSLTLANHAEQNARALAESLERATSRALAAEERKRWRYRLEGGAVVGTLGALALFLAIL